MSAAQQSRDFDTITRALGLGRFALDTAKARWSRRNPPNLGEPAAMRAKTKAPASKPTALDPYIADDLAIGLVVQLASGGVKMTVTGHERGEIQVIWSGYSEFSERSFDPRLLRPVDQIASDEELPF